jgi:drug/metabolite transporter (DMT)-like permease
MLLWTLISSAASVLASSVCGTCTFISSPSKSALYGGHTLGFILKVLYGITTTLWAIMEILWSDGCLLKSTVSPFLMCLSTLHPVVTFVTTSSLVSAVIFIFLPSGLGAAPLGEVLFQLAYQGTLAVVVAGFLFTRALIALGPMAVTAITAVVPALTALAAWPLLGEPLGAGGLVGVGLVTAAMLLGVAETRRSGPGAVAPR